MHGVMTVKMMVVIDCSLPEVVPVVEPALHTTIRRAARFRVDELANAGEVIYVHRAQVILCHHTATKQLHTRLVMVLIS